MTKAFRTARFEYGFTIMDLAKQAQEALMKDMLDELAKPSQRKANYITAAELCKRSGLTLDDLAAR